MRLRRSKYLERIIIWLLIRICYDFCYIKYICIRYHSAGFNLSYSGLRLFFSLISFIFISFLVMSMNKKQDTPASLVSRILHIMYFIPATSMFAYGGIPSAFFFCTTIYAIILFILLIYINKFDISTSFHVNNPEKVMKYISVFLCLIVLFVFAYYGKFRFQFDLLDVYGRRMEARGYNVPSTVSRVLGLARNSLPLFIVYYSRKKNMRAVIFILFVIFCNFSIDGSKTVFFMGLLSVLSVLFLTPKLISKIEWLFLLFMFFSIITFLLTSFDLPLSLILRRMCFVPVLLGSYYYDYVLLHDYYFFSSLWRFVGIDDSRLEHAYEIGTLYFNSPEMSANTGLVGDAIINLGPILGVILLPILVAMVVLFFNIACKKMDVSIYMISVVYLAISLINSSYFTMLFTHGIAMLIIVLYVMGKDKDLHANEG